jgi:hypothetical protein
MTETFHTRIPTLPDGELQKYLQQPGKYKLEAIEAAAAELRKRGYEVSDLELERIREKLDHRDGTRKGLPVPPRLGLLHDGTGPRMGRIRALTAGILALGFSGAAVIYRLAASAESTGIDLESEDSKRYLRELEAVAGKANLVASELRHWVVGLFQGKTLAYTVAWGTVILAAVFYFIATQKRSR